jgi:hypothetical protein
MKVRELITLLKHEDPDAEVMVGYNQNDHWDTELATPATAAGTELLAWHDGYQKWTTEEGGEEREAVVIR